MISRGKRNACKRGDMMLNIPSVTAVDPREPRGAATRTAPQRADTPSPRDCKTPLAQ